MKKRNHRFITTFSSLALATLMLSACGGNDSKTDESAAQGSGKDEKVKITLMSNTYTESPEGPEEEKMAEAYMKEHPNVTIEFMGVPTNDYMQQLVTLATAGNLPDAFALNPTWGLKAQEMGVTEDLNNLLTDEDKEVFYDYALDEATINDEMVYLNWFLTPPALIYRTDWFEEKDLTPPETWEDFQKVAKELTEDTDGDGKIDRWGFGMLGMRNESAESRFFYIMRTFGVELLKEEDGKWTTDVGSDKFKECLQMFTDFSLKDGIVPPGVTEMGYPEVAQQFASEQVATMVTGPNAIGTAINQNENLEGKIGSIPIPKDVQHTTVLTGQGYGINKDSKHKEVVLDYLKFMTNYDNSLNWNEVTGRVPTRKDVGESQQLTTPAMKGFVDALEYNNNRPEHPGLSEAFDAMGEAYQAVLSGDSSVDEASEMAQQKVEEIIANYE